MVRGHAKEVAQQKNAAKTAEKAKSAKRDSSEVRNIFILIAQMAGWSDYHHLSHRVRKLKKMGYPLFVQSVNRACRMWERCGIITRIGIPKRLCLQS